MFGGIYGPCLVDYFTMGMLTLPDVWRDIRNLSNTLPSQEELTNLVNILIEDNVSNISIEGTIIEWYIKSQICDNGRFSKVKT